MSQNIEHDWVERARQGEPAAVAELYRRYWRAARAAAYGVTGDLSLAEDAASEAFSAAMSGLADLRDPQRFGPWLRTIVVRTARRFKIASSATKGIEPQALPDTETAAPGENLEQQELAVLIREAVGSLPGVLREAISLFYFEGYNVEEAARFLGVPSGTLKRRLHDGRQRLQSAAEHILEGRKPMDPEREQILRQLREAANEGLGSDAFYQVMRKTLNLRPVPRELLQVIRKHHEEAIRKRGQAPLLSSEQEQRIREGLRQIHEPSERARDPNHPVGAAANAIRAALPEFCSWQVDISQIDLSERARQLFTDRAEALSYLLPPDFIEKSRGAYVSAERAVLIKDQDGSVVTMAELMGKKATQEAFSERVKEGGCMSDALGLLWKQLEPLELRAVEDLLRRLSEQIVPETPVRLSPYEEPRYRAALRMQLGDNPIPAAIGGALNPWQGLPPGLYVASVAIHLEPWASIQSRQTIELVEGTPFPWFGQSAISPNDPVE
jgi:RNA polymerase sigma factor (sigma-70 family)